MLMCASCLVALLPLCLLRSVVRGRCFFLGLALALGLMLVLRLAVVQMAASISRPGMPSTHFLTRAAWLSRSPKPPSQKTAPLEVDLEVISGLRVCASI